jgi:hypothetical protein
VRRIERRSTPRRHMHLARSFAETQDLGVERAAS